MKLVRDGTFDSINIFPGQITAGDYLNRFSAEMLPWGGGGGTYELVINSANYMIISNLQQISISGSIRSVDNPTPIETPGTINLSLPFPAKDLYVFGVCNCTSTEPVDLQLIPARCYSEHGIKVSMDVSPTNPVTDFNFSIMITLSLKF